jgi:creatinine amidohydrolase
VVGAYLAELTWPEAAQALARHPVAVLPLGAAAKQHGRHLPLDTDRRQAEALARLLAARSPVLILPTLAYGYYPAFLDYPGSVSVRLGALRDTVVDICASLHRHGAGRFYVLNTGISTCRALEPARLALVERGIAMEYTDIQALFGPIDAAVAEQAEGGHADELETSLMLAIAPERVHLERAERDMHPRRTPGPFTRDGAAREGRYSPSGAYGDPTLASADKGRRLLAAYVEALAGEVSRLAAPDYRPGPTVAR